MLQTATKMTSNPSQNPTEDSDSNMKVELVVNDRAEAIVFHNKPFTKNLSWLEFDLDTNKLQFIMNDGDVRDFGIPVAPELAKHMQNAFQVLMVLMDDKTKKPQEGNYIPLIIHRT